MKPGTLTLFPQSVQLQADETVVFSGIVYALSTHRNGVSQTVMNDPCRAEMMAPNAMPFDGKRLVSGGFEMLVDLGRTGGAP